MRVRKLFIFYDYKKQITCVGADDRQKLVSGFIDSTPVNTPPVERNGGKTVLYGLSDSLLKLQNCWNNVFWDTLFEF